VCVVAGFSRFAYILIGGDEEEPLVSDEYPEEEEEEEEEEGGGGGEEEEEDDDEEEEAFLAELKGHIKYIISQEDLDSLNPRKVLCARVGNGFRV
jgi:hypothetical protein